MATPATPPPSKWFLWAAVAAGPAAVVALEAGWIVTEVGRQPWIVYEVMRVEEAVNTADGLRYGYFALIVVYTALTVATVAVLRRTARGAAPACPRPGAAGRADVPPRPPPAGPRGADRRRRGRDVVGLTMYAVFAGADFGAGFWDLFAGGAGARRPAPPHREVIGPVWEANHVWLIFVLVVLWTGFPEAFARIMTCCSCR